MSCFPIHWVHHDRFFSPLLLSLVFFSQPFTSRARCKPPTAYGFYKTLVARKMPGKEFSLEVAPIHCPAGRRPSWLPSWFRRLATLNTISNNNNSSRRRMAEAVAALSRATWSQVIKLRKSVVPIIPTCLINFRRPSYERYWRVIDARSVPYIEGVRDVRWKHGRGEEVRPCLRTAAWNTRRFPYTFRFDPLELNDGKIARNEGWKCEMLRFAPRTRIF